MNSSSNIRFYMMYFYFGNKTNFQNLYYSGKKLVNSSPMTRQNYFLKRCQNVNIHDPRQNKNLDFFFYSVYTN